MKNVTIIDEKGNKQTALLAESEDDVKHIVLTGKKSQFKDHLYTGYLILGTIAFAIGIYISYRKIKSAK